MGSFKTPRTGGNVIHRIDLGGGARRRPRQRGRASARTARFPGASDRGAWDGAARPGPAPAASTPPAELRDDVDLIPAATPRPSKRVAAEAAALDRPRSTDAPAQGGGSQRQIDLLERRLAKMARLLEAKEKEVAMIGAAPAEHGVASVFREVQGLEGSGDEVARKKEFMSRIFEANLDLRKQIIPG